MMSFTRTLLLYVFDTNNTCNRNSILHFYISNIEKILNK